MSRDSILEFRCTGCNKVWTWGPKRNRESLEEPCLTCPANTPVVIVSIKEGE